jgi:hypothetical protein
MGVRRRAALLAILALVLVAGAAGCGSDSSGTARAAGAAPPPSQAPPVGACYLAVVEVSRVATDRQVDCATVHRAETAAVGVFAGLHAAADRPPAPGTTALRAAFADCDAEVSTFVGGDWRGAALSVKVAVPDPVRWSGGARWFRCDLYELVSVDGGTARRAPLDTPKERTGSLRGVVKGGRSPAYSCFTEDEWSQLWPAGCTDKHRFEYVGIWTAPDLAFEEMEDDDERLFRECRKVINVFLGLPRSSAVGRQMAGVTFRLPSPEAWSRGDRGVRCFLWSDDKVLTRSLRGTGARVLVGD